MNIKSLAIYGSTARGDRNKDSDFDCFAIYDEKYYKMVVKGKVNIAFYPLPLAEKIMREGSIFALHIAKEGVPYFNDELFNTIVSLFKYKEDYYQEIDTATKLLNFILSQQKKIENKILMNKRISWCVRTILISMSAMDRNPLFSKEMLARNYSSETISSDDIIKLISLKSSHCSNKKDLKIVDKFIDVFGRDVFIENKDKFLTKSMSRLISGVSTVGY